MKTFIYARVSSAGQRDNYSFAAQKADGISFAESIGSEYRLYKDVESGAKSSRKDWTRLKADLETLSEPNDVIWYGSQSRLARDAEEFQVFMKLCIDRKLRLFEKTENRYIDFGKSSGDRIVGGIKSIIATEERIETARRTKEGREDSYDEGLRNHNRTFGYETVFDERGNKRYEVVPQQAEVIKRVFGMYAKGSTIYGIVKRLN
ncbi:MAG: recombinase family protein, partial [Spirochaetia bacterium]